MVRRCEIPGVMRDQDLQMGYNDMSMIPAGATNIVITEVTLPHLGHRWYISIFLDESIKQLLGPEEQYRPLLSEW